MEMIKLGHDSDDVGVDLTVLVFLLGKSLLLLLISLHSSDVLMSGDFDLLIQVVALLEGSLLMITQSVVD